MQSRVSGLTRVSLFPSKTSSIYRRSRGWGAKEEASLSSWHSSPAWDTQVSKDHRSADSKTAFLSCGVYCLRSFNMASSNSMDSKVREIALDMMTDTNNYDGDTGLRWQSSAILALQEATEAYLVHLFEDAWVTISSPTPRNLSCFHAITEIYVPYTQSEWLSCNAIFNWLGGSEVHGVGWHDGRIYIFALILFLACLPCISTGTHHILYELHKCILILPRLPVSYHHILALHVFMKCTPSKNRTCYSIN